MANAKPFDEVRIGQRIVRRRPVGACEFTLDPGKARTAQFRRRLEIKLQQVAHQKRSIHDLNWVEPGVARIIPMGDGQIGEEPGGASRLLARRRKGARTAWRSLRTGGPQDAR